MSSRPFYSWIKCWCSGQEHQKILLQIFVLLSQTLSDSSQCYPPCGSVFQGIFCYYIGYLWDLLIICLRPGDSLKKKLMSRANWSILNRTELTPFLNALCTKWREQVPTSRKVVFSRYEDSNNKCWNFLFTYGPSIPRRWSIKLISRQIFRINS